MKHFVLNLKTFKTVVASSEQEAKNLGNGSIIFRSSEQLAKNPNTTGQVLVRAFNELSPVETKKFADKFSGAKRLFKLVQESSPKNDFYGKFESSDVSKETYNSIEELAASAEKSAANNEKPKKPRGKFAGKVIKLLVDKNPRREATHGFHSMGILINASPSNVTFEDYIKDGGRIADLQWDLNKGNVELI